MIRLIYFLNLIIFSVCCSCSSRPNDICNSLPDSTYAIAQEAFKSVHIYHCCYSSLSECLAKDTICSTALHLQGFGCWLAKNKKGTAEIVDDINKRYQMFLSKDTCEFSQSPYPTIGTIDSTNDSMVITVFTSVTCPACKLVVCSLHDEIVSGELKGKALLHIKPFSTHSAERILLASTYVNKFWDLYLTLCNVKQRIDDRLLKNRLDSLQVDTAFIDSIANLDTVTALLKKSKEEGHRYDVSVTPTIFLNKKRYNSYKNPVWIMDAIDIMQEHKRNQF